MAGELGEWVFESVLQFLRSPLWTTPVHGFVETHCHVFDAKETENKLEYTALHNRFRELVDKTLSEYLNELGVPIELFVNAVRSSDNDELSQMVSDYIVALDDFTAFRAMMEKKNLEFELEAMYEYAKYAQGAADEEDDEMDDDERFLLEMAIHMSLGDEDVTLKRLEKEDAEALHRLAVQVAQEQEKALREVMAEEEKEAVMAEADQKIEQLNAKATEERSQRIQSAVSEMAGVAPQPIALGDLNSRRNMVFGQQKAALPGIPAGEASKVAQPTFNEIKSVVETSVKAVNPAAPVVNKDTPSEAEMAQRAEYFKAHRERLRRQRQEEREADLQEYKAMNGQQEAPQAAVVNSCDDKENQQAEMRKELARRFHEDLLQESRVN